MRRVLSLFVALLLSACGGPAAPPPPGAIESESILRFAEVGPGIYRGGQPDEEGLRQLRALGVRTVVDLRHRHDEAALVRAYGMEPVSIPMEGGKAAPAPNAFQLRRFLEVVRDPARQPVFVHCKRGRDRTGTLFAARRIEVDGWTNERALEEMRAFGFRDDHPHLLQFVETYRPGGPPKGDGSRRAARAAAAAAASSSKSSAKSDAK